MSRRDQIKMSEEEIDSFLEGERTVIVATNGRDGFPHLMPLWYVLRGRELWAWTFAKSQKTRNLERDDRVTLVVEAGEEYSELRGVMIKARCVLYRDAPQVAELGKEIARRYGGELGEDAEAAFEKQAAKRVGLQFVAESTATWDHRKLGGGY